MYTKPRDQSPGDLDIPVGMFRETIDLITQTGKRRALFKRGQGCGLCLLLFNMGGPSIYMRLESTVSVEPRYPSFKLEGRGKIPVGGIASIIYGEDVTVVSAEESQKFAKEAQYLLREDAPGCYRILLHNC